MGTLIAHFCVTLAAALCIGGRAHPYDPLSTQPVYFYGVQAGVYVDDTQPNQCRDVGVERQKWALVIAGNAPGDWPQDRCPAATFNALEWGQFWGGLPASSAYILEGAKLGPLTTPAPEMTRRALAHRPGLIVYWGRGSR